MDTASTMITPVPASPFIHHHCVSVISRCKSRTASQRTAPSTKASSCAPNRIMGRLIRNHPVTWAAPWSTIGVTMKATPCCTARGSVAKDSTPLSAYFDLYQLALSYEGKSPKTPAIYPANLHQLARHLESKAGRPPVPWPTSG